MNIRTLLLLAISAGCALAGAPSGTVTDRNGVVLAEGGSYPFQALAAHVLDALPPADQPVALTLDARIQFATERALREIGRGAAVVVDPRTGDILALASVPSFDPGHPDPGSLVNHCLSGYAPGATLLPVTALAGARHGLIDQPFTCTGRVSYSSKFIKCWIASKGGQHGELTVAQALAASCGPFFYQLGNAAGIEEIVQVGEMLGLGQKSGMGLADESAGVLPGPEWLQKSGLRDQWTDGHTANLSIGQGYVLTTPLQMAMVAAAIADGTSRQPRLFMSKPRRLRARLTDEGISERALATVRQAMQQTVKTGIAQRAAVPGIAVAGRTGTAQCMLDGVKDNHTWFIGFAPFAEPEVAVCIFVQGAKAGGAVAAPIAARIIQAALHPPENIEPVPPAESPREPKPALNPAL